MRVDCFTEEVGDFNRGPPEPQRSPLRTRPPGFFSSTPGRGVVNLLVRSTVVDLQFHLRGICCSKGKAFGILGHEGWKDGTSTKEAKTREENTINGSRQLTR